MSEKTSRQIRKELNKQYSSAFIYIMNAINSRAKKQTFIQRLKVCFKYLLKKEFEI